MTVHGDLERAIAMAEASRGNYLLFATESEDDKAKKVFEDMAEDMQRHVTVLESRQQYLGQYNQLNAGGGNQNSGNQNSGNQNSGNQNDGNQSGGDSKGQQKSGQSKQKNGQGQNQQEGS